MKTFSLLLFVFLFSTNVFSQNVIKEFVDESNFKQSELFSKVKMFIVDKWNNPKKSIQNEDKDLGIIQIKTEKEFESNVGMGLSCIYRYEYMTKIRVKDWKFKIEIYDVNCIFAKQTGLGTVHDIPLIPYFDGDKVPVKTKKMGKGISKEKAVKMMEEIRSEFDYIISTFSQYLNKEDDF